MAQPFMKTVKETLEAASGVLLLANGIAGIVAFNSEEPSKAILMMLGASFLAFGALALSTKIQPPIVTQTIQRVGKGW
ncbi:MAG: hypothetical protein AAF718_03570 [Pseudomonadota bacterium]